MVAILAVPSFFFHASARRDKSNKISSLGNKERLNMNRCATFAYRLIVPQSRHNNLEIVLSRKRRKRGKRGGKGGGGGIKIGKGQVRVKIKK